MIQGDYLLGSNSFFIAPHASGSYELVYQPLKQGRFRGSVAFINEKLGEIWYEILMAAEEMPV